MSQHPPAAPAQVIDLQPDVPRHMKAATVDGRPEFSGLADGGIAAAAAVTKDEVTLRRVSPTFRQGSMPARNPDTHGLDA